MAAGNREVARLLRELADLIKLDEGAAQSFRVRAYDNAPAPQVGQILLVKKVFLKLSPLKLKNILRK